MARLPITLVLLSVATLLPLSAQAEGQSLYRWAGRLQLSSLDGRSDASPRLGGSRLLSANLMGDYYLTSAGSARLQGGLRATGGLMMGSLSLSQSSGGLALGAGSGSFLVGQRSYALSGPTEGLEQGANLSYLGIGYSAQLRHTGLAFSADLGLMSGSLGSVRLGRSSALGVEEAWRDLRFRPLLQLGLAYSY